MVSSTLPEYLKPLRTKIMSCTARPPDFSGQSLENLESLVKAIPYRDVRTVSQNMFCLLLDLINNHPSKITQSKITTQHGGLLNAPFVVVLNTFRSIFLIGQVRDTNPQILVYGAIEDEEEDVIESTYKVDNSGLAFYRLCPAVSSGGKVNSEDVRELVMERPSTFQLWQIQDNLDWTQAWNGARHGGGWTEFKLRALIEEIDKLRSLDDVCGIPERDMFTAGGVITV